MTFYNFAKLAILTIAIFAATASAQDFEYGKPEELKGLTTYNVETYSDLNIRNKLIAEIEKALPMLKLVEDPQVPQIDIGYKSVGSTFLSGAGLVTILARGPDKSRPRVIMNFNNEQDSKAERKPHTKFIREFIKLYKKANDLK